MKKTLYIWMLALIVLACHAFARCGDTALGVDLNETGTNILTASFALNESCQQNVSIQLGADDIIFDGQGFTLTGNYISLGVATGQIYNVPNVLFHGDAKQNLTVRNVNAYNYSGFLSLPIVTTDIGWNLVENIDTNAGLQLSMRNNTRVDNLTLHDIPIVNLTSNPTAIVFQLCKNSTLVNSHIYNIGQPTFAQPQFLAGESYRYNAIGIIESNDIAAVGLPTVIENNLVENVTQYAINAVTGSGLGNLTNYTVRNNIFKNTAGAFFNGGGLVENNQFSGISPSSLHSYGAILNERAAFPLIVRNNTFEGMDSAITIRMNKSNAVVYDNRIYNTTSRNFSWHNKPAVAINLLYNATGVPFNNLVENNTIYMPDVLTANTNAVIFEDGVYNNTFKGNTIGFGSIYALNYKNLVENNTYGVNTSNRLDAINMIASRNETNLTFVIWYGNTPFVMSNWILENSTDGINWGILDNLTGFGWTPNQVNIMGGQLFVPDPFPSQFYVRAYATDAYGASDRYQSSANGEIVNGIPNITSLYILPVSGFVDSILRIFINTTDNDDSTLSWNCTMYNQSVLLSVHAGSVSVNSDTNILNITPPLQIGDIYRVECFVSDGITESSLVVSDDVIIGNSAPIISSVSVTPAPLVYDNQDISAYLSVSDADNDTLNITFEWYINDVPYRGGYLVTAPGAGILVDVLNASEQDINNDIHILMQADDGTSLSIAEASGNTTVMAVFTMGPSMGIKTMLNESGEGIGMFSNGASTLPRFLFMLAVISAVVGLLYAIFQVIRNAIEHRR